MVEDSFDLSARGLVLLPCLPESARPGALTCGVLRPTGPLVVTIGIAALEHFRPSGFGHVLRLPGLHRGDVPPGTLVVAVQPAAVAAGVRRTDGLSLAGGLPDGAVVEGLRALGRTRRAVEVADALGRLRGGALEQFTFMLFFKRAFPAIPLRTLIEAGAWTRFRGGLTDEGFDAMLSAWLPTRSA